MNVRIQEGARPEKGSEGIPNTINSPKQVGNTTGIPNCVSEPKDRPQGRPSIPNTTGQP